MRLGALVTVLGPDLRLDLSLPPSSSPSFFSSASASAFSSALRRRSCASSRSFLSSLSLRLVYFTVIS